MQEEAGPILIVGGGIAGLRLYEMLREGDRHRNVRLLEASDRVGGRVRTQYEHGQVAYETGPWRIPEAHTRAVELFARHDVPLVPLETPSLAAHGDALEVPGLTTYDVNLLQTRNPHRADAADQATGYAGETHADSSTAPYSTGARRFFVAPDGFSSLVEKMAVDVPVLLNHRVLDLAPEVEGYRIRVVRRVGGNSFEETELYAAHVFLCVPPRVIRAWPSFYRHARASVNRVVSAPLHHVYAEARLRRPAHLLNASRLLVQTISSQYRNAWMQASYTAGRMARFWYRLHLLDPRRFLSLLRSELEAAGATPVGEGRIASHYWEHAFHMWRAVPGFELARAVETAVSPNWIRFPRVYWAGEAFSSYQAWIEGALETAELAHARFLSQEPNIPERALAQGEIVVEDRIIGALSAWAEVHPGGAEAIRNHLGENATALFEHIGHSDNAWAVLGSRQVAWHRRSGSDRTLRFLPLRSDLQ